MDRNSDGCRLCLDPYAECFTSIENPELKNQMEKVFSFAVESKPEYRSQVCQNCSYTISEFYQFSERVRQNQKILNGTAENIIPSMITLDYIKVETLCDNEILELTEKAIQLDEIIPKKEADSISDESEAPVNKPIKRFKKGDENNNLISKHFPMVCDICKTEVSSYKLLSAHFWEEHKLRRTYLICCTKKLNKRHRILDHIKIHANPDAFRCDLCGKRYDNSGSLTAHKGIHEGWVCRICDRMFKSKKGFVEHMEKAVHGKNKQTAQCDVCMKTFTSVVNLNTHKRRIHVEAKHGCEFCGKMFKNPQHLKVHRTIHTGEVIYNCEYCEKKTRIRRYMHKHMKNMHPVQWVEKQQKSPSV